MKINKTRLKLKIELFFKEQLWQLLLVVAFLLFCGWLFDKMIVAILFAVSHTVIRPRFEKQFHAKTTYVCMFMTLTISFFGISYCLPLNISLLSAIPVCYFISWVGYIAQDRLDSIAVIKKLKHKSIWEMDENELADYCFAKGIRGDMLEFVVMILIHDMKFEEIGEKLGYAVPTLKDWSRICKQKLEIKSWKN